MLYSVFNRVRIIQLLTTIEFYIYSVFFCFLTFTLKAVRPYLLIKYKLLISSTLYTPESAREVDTVYIDLKHRARENGKVKTVYFLCGSAWSPVPLRARGRGSSPDGPRRTSLALPLARLRH